MLAAASASASAWAHKGPVAAAISGSSPMQPEAPSSQDASSDSSTQMEAYCSSQGYSDDDACSCAPGSPRRCGEGAFDQADSLDVCSDAATKQALIAQIRHHMVVELEVQPRAGFLEQPCAGPLSQCLTPGAAAGERPNPGMRMIVVSWMVEVAEEFRLQQETLHLATGLLDRFLASNQAVPRCVLQLLAVTCILLASKALETMQPSVTQLCAVTAHHFKPRDVLRMERIVLDVLEFRLTSPSSYTFLHLLAQACCPSVTPGVLSLAMYLCELAVLEYDMHRYAHSTRAVAALLLAQLSIGEPGHLAALLGVIARLGVPPAALAPAMQTLLHLQQVAFSHALAAAARAAAAAGLQVTPAQAAAAAGAVGGADVSNLLTPLRSKFGAACWCEVSGAPPLPAVPAVLHLLRQC